MVGATEHTRERAMSDINTSLEDFSFGVGPAGDGEYIALSVREPYFCVFGESEEAVLELAKRAVAAYLEFKETAVATPATEQRDVSITSFQSERTVQLNELALA